MSQQSVTDTCTMFSIREVGKNVPVPFDRNDFRDSGTYFIDEAEAWREKHQRLTGIKTEIVRIEIRPMSLTEVQDML